MAAVPSRRSSMLMLGGQLVGQLSLVVAIPLLTRMFSPAAMGPYQVASSLALIAQPLATLSLDYMIPVAVSRQRYLRYWRIGLASVAGFSVAFVGVGIALSVARVGDEGSTLLMCGLLTGAYGWMIIDNALLIRRGFHGRLAVRNLLSGTLAAGLQLVGALITHNVLSLAVAILLARLVAILLTRSRAQDEEEQPGATDGPFSVSRAAFTTASNVVASGSNQVLTVASGAILGTTSAGYIGIAQRVAGTPISLIGFGLSQLIQANIAPTIRARKADLTRSLRKSVLPLAGLAALAATGLIVLGPLLAVPILGQGWQLAGEATAVLAIPLSLQLVVSPITSAFVMIGKSTTLFVLQASRFVSSALVCVFGAVAGWDVLGLCFAYAIVVSLGYGVILVFVFVEARAFDYEVLKQDQVGARTADH